MMRDSLIGCLLHAQVTGSIPSVGHALMHLDQIRTWEQSVLRLMLHSVSQNNQGSNVCLIQQSCLPVCNFLFFWKLSEALGGICLFIAVTQVQHRLSSTVNLRQDIRKCKGPVDTYDLRQRQGTFTKATRPQVKFQTAKAELLP